MRAIRMTAFAASLLLASGCVVVSGGGGGGGTSGDITVNWTFGGTSCATAGVDSIDIQVSGPADGASKTVSCAADPQGITISNFIPDTYDVTITGYDAAGTAIYGMANPQSVTIAAGSNSYDIEVPALVGDLTVYWGQFGSFADCTAANIPTIRATLEDASGNILDDHTYSCGDGGVTWNQISPATYTVILNGMDASGFVYYAASSQVDVTAGQAKDYTVDLADNSGQLTVQWTFGGSSACGSVATVHLKIYDANNNTLDDATYNCADGGEVYDTAPAGGYTVDAVGYDSTGLKLYSGSNPNVTVTAGTTQTYVVDMQ